MGGSGVVRKMYGLHDYNRKAKEGLRLLICVLVLRTY